MEQKTIGKFITALRKANGMTQKDLAEKLSVSDKTISRWERDEGLPDLSVIPVIAEIFGVTCDEILRGERKPASERSAEPVEEPTAKGEKQRQRILTMSLSKYRTQCFISIGISAVGLIAAMICNLGFLRAYIGFFVGAIFYMASLVCQAIFVNGAFLTFSNEDLAGAEIDRFKTSVIDLAKQSICITLTILGGTLPLILFPYDTYSGLEIKSWILSGLLLAALTRMVCGVAWYFLHPRLVKKGVCILVNQDEETYWYRHKLKRNYFAALAILLAVTLLGQVILNEVLGAFSLAEGTQFCDYESFVAYMEQDVPYYYESEAGGFMAVEPIDSVYYDEYGNEITEEEAFREEVVMPDGTPEGKVVCTFIQRNHSVVSWRTADSEDGLPITVVTHSDYEAANRKMEMINIGFLGLYVIECIAVVSVYRKKRMK